MLGILDPFNGWGLREESIFKEKWKIQRQKNVSVGFRWNFNTLCIKYIEWSWYDSSNKSWWSSFKDRHQHSTLCFNVFKKNGEKILNRYLYCKPLFLCRCHSWWTRSWWGDILASLVSASLPCLGKLIAC